MSTLNAGTATITLAGTGSLQLAGNQFTAAKLVDNGSVVGNFTVASGQSVEGSGGTGVLTVASGAVLGSPSGISTFGK